MLLRLISSVARKGLPVQYRLFHRTPAALSVGHHGHGPIKSTIPQPGPWERNLFGEGKTPRISKDAPYVPKSSDFSSFFGAGVGVLLTFIAVIQSSSSLNVKDSEVPSISPESPVVHDKGESTPSSSSEKIPEQVEYLLVGSGAASYYAALAIRARDGDAKVLMIGDEEHLPYNRPPLSKELWWYGDESARKSLEYKALSGKTRDVFFESAGFFVKPSELPSLVHGAVSLVSGRKVIKVNAAEKKAILDNGTEIKYGKCLIATGSQPKAIPQLLNDDLRPKILTFRGVEDYRKLDEVLSHGDRSVTIIGGGFLGSELAYSVRRKYGNVKVNQVISEEGNLAKILPSFLSIKVTNDLKDTGVNVHTGNKVKSATLKNDKVEIELDDCDQKLISDIVVVAVGVHPDVSVAKNSGFKIDPSDGGVVADAKFQVAPNVYCAGDMCSFVDNSLGRRRIEHWEHAQISGRLAGENMTGGEKAFWYQPSYFTKISPGFHINAVGNTDSSLQTVSVFAKDLDEKQYERGVVFYKNEKDQVVGVLCVNVFGPSIDVARRVIEEGRPVDDFRELSKLFPLYDNPKDEQKKDALKSE